MLDDLHINRGKFFIEFSMDLKEGSLWKKILDYGMQDKVELLPAHLQDPENKK